MSSAHIMCMEWLYSSNPGAKRFMGKCGFFMKLMAFTGKMSADKTIHTAHGHWVLNPSIRSYHWRLKERICRLYFLARYFLTIGYLGPSLAVWLILDNMWRGAALFPLQLGVETSWSSCCRSSHGAGTCSKSSKVFYVVLLLYVVHHRDSGVVCLSSTLLSLSWYMRNVSNFAL